VALKKMDGPLVSPTSRPLITSSTSTPSAHTSPASPTPQMTSSCVFVRVVVAEKCERKGEKYNNEDVNIIINLIFKNMLRQEILMSPSECTDG